MLSGIGGRWRVPQISLETLAGNAGAASAGRTRQFQAGVKWATHQEILLRFYV
jgi:hypothetical protein